MFQRTIFPHTFLTINYYGAIIKILIVGSRDLKLFKIIILYSQWYFQYLFRLLRYLVDY